MSSVTTRPAAGVCHPAMMLSSVLLPEPDGPVKRAQVTTDELHGQVGKQPGPGTEPVPQPVEDQPHVSDASGVTSTADGTVA